MLDQYKRIYLSECNMLINFCPPNSINRLFLIIFFLNSLQFVNKTLKGTCFTFRDDIKIQIQIKTANGNEISSKN